MVTVPMNCRLLETATVDRRPATISLIIVAAVIVVVGLLSMRPKNLKVDRLVCKADHCREAVDKLMRS